jgi:hypothetical protein
MKTRILTLILILSFILSACTPGSLTTNPPVGASPNQTAKISQPAASAQDSGSQGQPGGAPPQEAITACTGLTEQAACTFTSPKGSETGVCETVQSQLACSPQRGPAGQTQKAQSANPSAAQPAQSTSASKTQKNSAQSNKTSATTQPANQGKQAASQNKQGGGQDKQPGGGGTPPQEAIAACTGKTEQAVCTFTSPKGSETGVCQTTQTQLACKPDRTDNQGASDQPQNDKTGNAYNTEQAISDKAQGMTIAYDALAFLTGDLGSDSFFPPGKVADFWGFQYLRDNDPTQMGHAGAFLTSAAMNTLTVLSAEQRAQLVALAKSQVSQINEYGYKRFVLMDAFRRSLEGNLPSGTTELNPEAVKTYSAELYKLDGQISFARAQLMGSLITSLNATQRAYLDGMVGKGMQEWPTVEEPSDIRGLDRDVKVAVMTYAADMFSWYAGSVEADVYFCPERHGTYFGSFYLKDIPAMSNPNYAIPTNLTGDMGETMLKVLTADQAKLVTSLVDIQKPYLTGIVETRRQVSVELRKFKDGSNADSAAVLGLMEKYGALDGEIIYNLAKNFTQVNQSLSADQKTQLTALRKEMLGDLMHPNGAYLYSQAVPMPDIPNTDFMFK